jgi:hypothetical protein
MASEPWPNAFRVAHLGGGLRAVNPPGPEVEFSPSLNGSPKGFRLQKYSHLHGALRSGGLSLIGVEFITSQQQIDGRMPSDWRPHWVPDGHLAHDAEQLWSQIATGGHDTDDYEIVDICRRIAFQLRAASWRLHDISEAYSRELSARTSEESFKEGERFESVNSFFIHLATHSFLSEMATLRDYLAEFIARYPLAAYNPSGGHVPSLAKLLEKVISRARGKHPLADEIAQITADGGWLKTMSAYRDLAVHHTPLASASHHTLLQQKLITAKDGTAFPSVTFKLPVDPDTIRQKRRASGAPIKSVQEWLEKSFGAKNADGPDALEYCHAILGLIAKLSMGVATHSPVSPKIAHFGPHNIIGPVIVKKG